MNKINDDLKFYGNYFHGIQDVKEHKSVGQVAIGILKIISLATIALPIIFGIGYLIAKLKFNDMSDLYARVTQSFNPNFVGAIPTQNDYIKFLFAKTQDKDYSLFETCFRQLEPSSQNSFFGIMAKKGYLIESMQQTPNDLEEIEFNLGEFLGHPTCFKHANALINEFLKELASFESLKEIVVDATGIADFTQNAESHLKWLQTNCGATYNSHLGVLDDIDVVRLSNTYSEPNNLGGALQILYGLVAHLQQSDKLEFIDILFANKKVRIQKNNESFDIEIE